MKKLFIILVLFLGCKKNESNVLYAGAIGFFYENAKGENLLDPKTIGALNDKDFTLYVMRNGIKSEIVNAANSNLPGNFQIENSPETGYYLFLTFGVDKEFFNGNDQTYFIKTSDGSEDKISVRFNSNVGPIIGCRRVGINDVVKWDASSGSYPSSLIIVK